MWGAPDVDSDGAAAMGDANQHAAAPEEQFTGTVIARGDPAYDDARAVWNGLIDRHPRAVVRCAGVEDVQAGIRFARTHELALAVRGGGHSAAGHGTVEDGLVIDLHGLDAISVGDGGATVRAGYVFANADRSAFTGTDPARGEVSQSMALAWASFARTGSPQHPGIPDWPAYAPEAPVAMRIAHEWQAQPVRQRVGDRAAA